MTGDTETIAHEIELIRRIGNGDRRAFEEFFATYGKRIFRYAARMIVDAAKAEEATSDVMLEVWKTAARFESRSRPSTWVLSIARHVCLNALRGKRIVTVDLDSAPEPGDPGDSSEALRDRDDHGRLIRRALTQLSADHREVVELTFYHGHSYEEIAAIVGCPENTVKTRMFHAKKHLRDALIRLTDGQILDVGAAS